MGVRGGDHIYYIMYIHIYVRTHQSGVYAKNCSSLCHTVTSIIVTRNITKIPVCISVLRLLQSNH